MRPVPGGLPGVEHGQAPVAEAPRDEPPRPPVRGAPGEEPPEVLYWVGCAASFDDRAKRIARAMAEVLTHAEVSFAILGEREGCTGDPARRMGNEYLFQTLAEANVATLDEAGVRTI